VTEQATPSARERQLARELRLLRSALGLHGKDVADRLGWSASKVSRIETSRIGISAQDLDRLLQLYHVPTDRAAYLRKLAPSARAKGWWDAYADTLSTGYATLIKLEAGSRALHCYCAVVPHALLQTPDYARQVICSSFQTPPPTEVDRRVQVCLLRQQRLTEGNTGHRLHLSAVIDESVLHRHVLGPDGQPDVAVMRGQLTHLVQTARWPNVTIQVLPFTAGLPPVTAGSFSVLEARTTEAADVVYLENKTRIFRIESEAEVHGYTQEFQRLQAMAMNPKESLKVVRRRLNDL
jgi:transcriptional regulator with XRE-family HTH domain